MGQTRKRRKSKSSPNTTPTTPPDIQIRKKKKNKQCAKKSKIEYDESEKCEINSSEQTGEQTIKTRQSENDTVETLSVISEPSGQLEHSDTDQFVDAEDYIDEREVDTQITISTVNTTIMDVESTETMDETLFSSQIQPGHDQVTTTVSQFTSTPTHVLHMPQYQHMPHIPYMSAMPQMSFSQPQPSLVFLIPMLYV